MNWNRQKKLSEILALLLQQQQWERQQLIPSFCLRFYFTIDLKAVDPWGRVVADAGGYPKDDMDENKSEIEPPPSIVTVEIDLTLIDSIRQRMPVDVHRSNASF